MSAHPVQFRQRRLRYLDRWFYVTEQQDGVQRVGFVYLSEASRANEGYAIGTFSKYKWDPYVRATVSDREGNVLRQRNFTINGTSTKAQAIRRATEWVIENNPAAFLSEGGPEKESVT